MSTEPLRIGIVGLGGICRSRHVPGLQAIDGVEIVAVANRSRASGETAAKEFRIPHVEDSWQELVTRDDLDVVFIGTWPYLHKPVTIAALDAGKHVFCQARMAMDFADAQKMYDHAEASDLVTGLCPVPFGLKYDKAVIRLLAERAVGDIRLVRVSSFASAYADADAPMNWRKDHRLSGLNMHTLGMYIEVVHRWFSWTRSVSAHTDTFVRERVDTQGDTVRVEIPDQVLCSTLTDDDVPVQYTINNAVHKGEDCIEIYGSQGAIRYDVFADEMFIAQGDGDYQPVEVRTDEFYDVENWSVERDFINAVRTGAEYHPDFLDGLKYMQVVDAVYRSAHDRRVIELPEAH
jgi:predicted dehydrogenase